MDEKSELQFLTEDIPSFTVGQAGSYVLKAAGGTPPYTFWTSSGALPDGLLINSGGEIYGTPYEAGDATVFFGVADAESAQTVQAFDIEVSTPD
ncbi:MAG: Ig domain-containing protein [Acidobacteriota bacterium]|nr:Ig domain-containing protein [Acidobacteriota bacterium]